MACGGKGHGFRFIQLPYNLVYNEALLLRNQTVGSEERLNILEAARKLNVGIFTSIPLFQARLLNAEVPDYDTGLSTKVEKVVQFVRSTPSIIAPLIGQKSPVHVNENINLAKIPPMRDPEFSTATKILFGD
jgi:predicted aldo/keto reductase-like oxidoreductase